MKFTDGYWQLRAGVSVLRPHHVDSVDAAARELTAYAPTGPIRGRGDTLNRPLVTVRLFSPAEGVVGVTIAHHLGGPPRHPQFEHPRQQTRSTATPAVTRMARTLPFAMNQ